ncbi:hypothetical protein [Spirosoma aerophilum]
MREEGYQDWLNMKAVLEDYLTVIDEQTLTFSATVKTTNTSSFSKKAIEYRDTIHKIIELLRKKRHFMSDVNSRTKQYFEEFERATSTNERKVSADNYKAYYAQLSPVDRATADQVTKPYLANALLAIQSMEPALQRAKMMLERIHSQPSGSITA